MSDSIIAGVGGQGTVLASKLLAKAALLEGHMVRTAETIGMAQRGGSVLGHVRITRENTYGGAHDGSFSNKPFSPIIPAASADLLIGFEPGETVRALPFLREGGSVVTTKQVMVPAAAAYTSQLYDGVAELDYLRTCRTNGRIGSLIALDGQALCTRIGSSRVLNVLLLGATLATKSIEITERSLIAALEALIKPEFIEVNKRALEAGITASELIWA